MKVRGMIVASVLLLALPFSFAQLPAPTYGWNLGNTLEPPGGEGTWEPAATQALINAVADSGFNTIRLPVAWDSHANQSTHVIDPVWMARVKQVVDWCYAKDLTVIVNCHWDGGWLENHITATVDPTIDAKMKSYWTQIATAFAAYDNRLLFAGANEPNCDTAAQWATLRSYYNTFISAVRAVGGNNATRWLVIQGPKTDITLTDQLVGSLPADSATGRLVVEVHYYPWRWTLMAEDASWGKMFYFWGQGYHSPTMLDRNSTASEEAFADEQFQKMATKFVSKGVPVIIGEWGAMKRTGYPDLTGTELDRHLASRTYYSKTITDKANALGLKPIWWDAGGTGSNTMWLFDRGTAAVIDPDNLRALTGGDALPPPGSGGNSGAAHSVSVPIRAAAGTGANGLSGGAPLGIPLAWTTTGPLVQPTADERHSIVAVKDPSVVFHDGRWHIFATTASSNGWRMAYLNFSSWDQAAKAKLVHLEDNPHFRGDYNCAPQVFYFRPHKKWYLIFQSQQPRFSTTDNIGDPMSWSEPQNFFAGTPKSVVEGWLDYWIICDDTHAYMFFPDDNGRFYRSRTRIEDFPRGFDEPVIVMQEADRADLFEGSSVYRIRGTNQFLCLVECADKNWNRYYRAFTADHLDGEWKPLPGADSAASPFAGNSNVSAKPGATPWANGISHGELLREGSDETMTVDPKNLQLLYQGIPPGASAPDYLLLPYRLALLRPASAAPTIPSAR